MSHLTTSQTIIVPSGDVEALYAAVYDETGLPRPHVEIRLAPGEYRLSPDDDQGNARRPNGGRLHLGLGASLIGPLVLPADQQGIPLSTSGDPDPNLEAIITYGELNSPAEPNSPFGFGAIIVDGGRVQGVTLVGVDDSAGTGIEIASTGVIRGVRVENAWIGLRVRASAGDPVDGGVEGTLFKPTASSARASSPFRPTWKQRIVMEVATSIRPFMGNATASAASPAPAIPG
jgi:hypothetical protein